MASKTIIQLEDDLDGSPASMTVPFGFEGMDYEIDLNDQHVEALRQALQPFIEKARRISQARRRASSSSGRSSSGRQTLAGRMGIPTKDIRDWAHAQGKAINERGRLPESLVREFMDSKDKPAEEQSKPRRPRAKRQQQETPEEATA